MAALPLFSLSSTVRASSVDTEHRLPYNRQRAYLKKPEALTAESPSTSAPAPAKKTAKIFISDLLKRNISKSTTQGESSESYLGYETWTPRPNHLEWRSLVLL
ncbi:hypothetical protein AAHA92_23283 [Salvia divinorum]|uniref:Uncharacterized protein n=1 Tax=Salvia divinorum TaxID=28513 RepID=A0ABD1GRG8_SALDI